MTTSSHGVTLQGVPTSPENQPCFRVCVDGEPTGSELFLHGGWLALGERHTPVPAPSVKDGEWLLSIVAGDRAYHPTTFGRHIPLSEFREFLADHEDDWRELHLANRRCDREAADGIAHRLHLLVLSERLYRRDAKMPKTPTRQETPVQPANASGSFWHRPHPLDLKLDRRRN